MKITYKEITKEELNAYKDQDIKEIVFDAIGGERDEYGRENVIVEETVIKGKVSLSQLCLVVNGAVVKYQDLYPMKAVSEKGPEYRKRKFFFVYYRGSTKKSDRDQRMKIRSEMISKLRDTIDRLYAIKERYNGLL